MNKLNKVFKVNSKYNRELVQNLESEMTKILSEKLAKSLDREIISKISKISKIQKIESILRKINN